MNQLEKAEQKLFTANAVVNGILNMKYVEIEAKQIEAKLDVKLPEILGITGTDLGVLFGNILDNAIEACESCKKENGSTCLQYTKIMELSFVVKIHAVKQ